MPRLPTATTPIASDTSFFQVPQNPNGVDPKQSLVGAYELTIRRGQQYATSLVGYSDSIAINPALLIQGDDRLEQQYTLVAPAATALAFSVGSLPSDGDTFTVNDGLGNARTFEFDFGVNATIGGNIATRWSGKYDLGRYPDYLGLKAGDGRNDPHGPRQRDPASHQRSDQRKDL